jgi:response regulator RpfG family c-di-GMP phosphodiesterase
MRWTILAVDDEPVNLRMLERLFHKDYHVLTATNGQEALKLIEQHNDIALIITDQRMPGMTGTEMLYQSMRTNPDAARIIITGYTDINALIDAINTTRVYKFVSKPWDPTELKETVQNALAERYVRLQQKKLAESLLSFIQSQPELLNLVSNNS